MKTRGSRLTIRGGIEAGTVRRRRWALSGALALALFAGLSRPSATLAAEGSDTATEDSEQAARRHFAEGDAAFKAGHYDDALKEFEAGYAVSRRPGFLLNMAHTQRKLGHLREARSLYKKYLLVDANSKLRDEVRSVIAELDSALADEDQAERDRKDRGAAGSRHGGRRGRRVFHCGCIAGCLATGGDRFAHGATPRGGAAGRAPAKRRFHDGRTRIELSPVLPAWLVLGRRRCDRAHGGRRRHLLVQAPRDRPLPRQRNAGLARQLSRVINTQSRL